MNPRPYQIETLDAVANAWKDGVSRQLVVLPTAGGKTIIFSMLPKWLRMRRPERMLVLVQAEELCFQAMKKLAAANPTLKIGLEKAEYKSTWSDDIVVASVQTLGGTEPDGNGGWKWGKRLSQINPENFTTVVIDECFPAGTDIAGVPIESIHPGDLSLSVNHQTGEARKKKVLSTFKKRPGGMVRVHFSDGSSLCCTPEHPFYIPASSAYRPALECAGFDVVRATMLSSGHAGIQMYGMRCRDQEADEVAAGHLREGRQGLLLQSVQRNLPGENIVLDDVSHQPEVRLGQNEGQQPDGKAWRPGEGKDHAPGDWMEAVSAGREWEGPDPAAAPAGINAGVGDGSGGADERQTGLYISHLLQAGHRQSRTNGRCGGGWVFPQLACDSSERPKEDGLFSLVRVDRVEVLEQTGDGTFGGVCPDGFVYNIEIEDDHNYFANGVLVHNCHHLVAQNYHGPLRYFGVMKSEPKYNNPNKLLVGVTATPNRSDNKGLEQFFEKITYSRDIRSMIKEGWLADIRAFRVETMVSLDGVATRQGDYAIGQLEKRINTPERNNLIADGYLKHGEGLPFLGFTVDIAHTIDLTECLRARGIKAMGISGAKGAVESQWLAYGKTARPAALEAYERGELDGLVSCQALLEGFDAPRATVALCARPTKSALLYTQTVGRVLRPFPAPEARGSHAGWMKQYAIVLDFVDNTSTNAAALNTVPSLFGLRPDFNMKGKKVMDELEEIEKLKASKPALNLSLYTDLEALRGVAEKIDLFAVPAIPPEIAKFSEYAWLTGLTAGSFQLVLPDKGVIRVQETTLGTFEVSRHLNGVKTPLKTVSTLKEAIAHADKQVPAESKILLANDASWRRMPVSDAQVGLLRRLYPELYKIHGNDAAFKDFVLKTYTKGQASSLISSRDKRSR